MFAGGLVQGEQVVRRLQPRLDEQGGRTQERVAFEIGPDLALGAVRRLDVGPGVAHEPHRGQVQERGGAVLAHVLDGAGGGVVGGGQVAAVGGEVFDAGTPRGRLHPALGRADADADAVVLAHEQQWQRLPLEGGVGGGVEAGQGAGVVDRGVAEAAHRDGVGGPGGPHAERPGPLDGERHAHGPRQMAGDGRGLRDDRQVGVAEHLVPAARDGLVGRGGQAHQHVADALLGQSPGLLGAGQIERARAVVEQRRVVGPQGGGHGRVALVTGGADRVVALVLPAQPAGGDVEQPAVELAQEQRPGLSAGQGRALADRQPRISLRARLERRNRLGEVSLNCVPRHSIDYVPDRR